MGTLRTDYRKLTDELRGMVERGEVSPVWALMFHERMGEIARLRHAELTGARAERRRASRQLRRLPPFPAMFK